MPKITLFLKLLATLSLLIQSPIVSAASSNLTINDIQDMLVNIQSILNPGLALMLAISFIIGVYFVLKGLLKLKSFAMPLTQMSQPGELSGPVIHILIGAVLIYIPTSTDVLSNTLFGSGVTSLFNASGAANVYNLGQASSLLSLTSGVTLESQWATLINTVVYYMQFIGFLAFLRGWIILSHHEKGQPSETSKGIIHIVGGILAINFLPLVKAILNTVNGVG